MQAKSSTNPLRHEGPNPLQSLETATHKGWPLLDGGRGIRTLVGLHPNGFQIRHTERIITEALVRQSKLKRAKNQVIIGFLLSQSAKKPVNQGFMWVKKSLRIVQNSGMNGNHRATISLKRTALYVKHSEMTTAITMVKRQNDIHLLLTNILKTENVT